jgi:hypothetical protein
MTTVHEPVGAIAAGRETPTDDLRRLLRADAALCLISGAVVAGIGLAKRARIARLTGAGR